MNNNDGGQNARNNLINIDLLRQLMALNNPIESKTLTALEHFKKIESRELSSKDNSLFNIIHKETKNISEFLFDSINKFHLLFNKNFTNFEDSLKYLEDISIPNKCICAAVIDSIPGWRCNDCSKYANAIYCNDCYLKFKDFHKNHNVDFLYSSEGMCDCGDPESLYAYCPEHSGPYKDQKEIDDYISKVFPKEILDNLNTFFETLFLKFSKYLVLSEKCDYFCKDFFNEKFHDNDNPLLSKEKEDCLLIKNNFCIVFQNLMDFLRFISHKNLGMLHLIANFLLKNHLENEKLEDEFMTTHRCVKIIDNDIKLFFTDNQKHACICPFLRLFLTNYRDDIKCNNENQEFLLSFSHNLLLRTAFCIIYFSTSKQIILNANHEFIVNKNQFFLEVVTGIIAKNTNLIEETYDFFYQYLLKYFKSPQIKSIAGSINEEILIKLTQPLIYIYIDTKYYSRPKIRKLMTEKTSIMERIIDCICLVHNQNEFKSIYPHPEFQNKKFSATLIDFENRLLDIIEEITMYIEWEKINYLKEIFKYLINKILNQEKEGIKILQNDEYSYHTGLYRCFGILMNSFCFNYAFDNKSTLFEAISIFKRTFFESQEEVETLVDIILKDYFKFFGFIGGCQNNYFNYYDSLFLYSKVYFALKQSYSMDFSLLKYLLVMTDKKIDIISLLKFSNLEKVYSLFEKAFILINNQKDEKNENEEKEKDNNKGNNNINIIENSINNNNINIIENNINNNITNNVINPENNINLRNQIQRPINVLTIEQIVLNNIYRNADKNRDEFYCILQWAFLLDLLITFMKDDSSPYWNLMVIYKESISLKTEKELFDRVKNNDYAMQDLKNILKEKLIHEIIAQGNLTNIQNVIKNIDQHLQKIFKENNEFNNILDELTYNKKNGEIKIVYLKDSYLKQLDLNYYLPNQNKTNAQNYILGFKKDVVKPYNYYYFNPSKLTFEFFETVFEKILLNENNLELMIKMIEKLLDNKKITEELDIKSIRNSLMPIILNYLRIFSVINSKPFIEFKNKNMNLINRLYELLSNSIKNNNNNAILEKDLEINIKEVISQLNWYQIESMNSNLSKLDKYDYNSNILEKLNDKEKNTNKINLFSENIKNINDNKEKTKIMKNKFKNLMNKRTNKFMDKVVSNQEMFQAINEQNNKEEKIGSNNEIMCFYCRNPIKLDSFDMPYGKIGLLFEDYFYINSIKSTIRSELSKIMNENKNEVYEKIINNINKDLFIRIISCGHYFHTSCFIEGSKKYRIGNKEISIFTCPLCLKRQNILIPPLNCFKENNLFLKSQNVLELFDEKINLNIFNSSKNSSSYKDIIEDFLTKINLNINKGENYISFMDSKYPTLKALFNYLENIFYINGTTFHKQQQIDTIQNIILSIRFIMKINSTYTNQIIKYIKDELINLIKGPNNDYIYKDSKFMRYADLLEKILISLIILFNYDEIKGIFKYIIYIFLPYFVFGFYFRDLTFKKEFKIIDKFKFKEKMNMNDLKKYIKDNNKIILKYFDMLLKKLYLIKVIAYYSNKNPEIINTFNELTLDNLFSLLDMEELNKLLLIKKNNKMDFIDIMDNLPKIFNRNDLFFKLFGNLFNYNKVFNSIFLNVKSNENIESILEKELIIQFAPIKFELIYLDNNIFDWIERNLGKECDVCKKVTKLSYICLICGHKVCHNNEANNHGINCGENYCLFIDMNNMNIIFWSKILIKAIFPIYVNNVGSGPKGYEMGREFYLSQEKLNLAIKNFVCIDIH